MKCYNGCPGPKLQTYLDELGELSKELRELNPEARCTHFPMEGKYVVHIWGKPLTKFKDSRLEAIESAIEVLRKKEK